MNSSGQTSCGSGNPPPKGNSEILGFEVAGTSEEIGREVSGWSVGDSVMSLVGGGGYAEFAVACADHLLPIPESKSFEEVACVCETYTLINLQT